MNLRASYNTSRTRANKHSPGGFVLHMALANWLKRLRIQLIPSKKRPRCFFLYMANGPPFGIYRKRGIRGKAALSSAGSTF